jgi:hypothetical protein
MMPRLTELLPVLFLAALLGSAGPPTDSAQPTYTMTVTPSP